jgi:hypothetical protein
MEKGYIVLTPEKIEDIFRDLEDKLYNNLDITTKEFRLVKHILDYKKQELLKQLTK